MIQTIAHRGNTKGKTEQENRPFYIMDAAKDNYVELDVWFDNDEFWLGHDDPTERVDHSFLLNDRFFCHAKNEEALHEMMKRGIHCFWHETDKVALTSKGFIWKYPEVYLNGKLWGICTDRV